MPAHDEWLTVWIGFWLWFAALIGLTGFASARKRMAGASRAEIAHAHGVRTGWGAALAAALAFLSWETTEGGILNYRVTNEDGSAEWAQIVPLYPANLREAMLIAKPDDWQPYDRWLKDFGKTYRDENGIEPKAELTPPQLGAYWAKARTEWAARLAALTGADLRQRDLRNADLARAFLPRSDLRGARLDGADLTEAELQGVELNCWDPSEGERHCASLQGANLIFAKMQGAILLDAQMQGANLKFAQMQGTDLSGAQMQGADLSSAKMQGAILLGAKMQGADLSMAQMQGTDLSVAEMQGADLRFAGMQGAELSGAQMQGANLRLAKMQGAECADATLRGASAHFADLTCNGLTQNQLDEVIGNEYTILPRGLHVRTCWETAPETLREFFPC
jgi:uncharacterized protein YjbI with pentapeptide repeats